MQELMRVSASSDLSHPNPNFSYLRLILMKLKTLFNYFVALVFLFFKFAYGGETNWSPVNMELGCVPFSDLYQIHPELSGMKTPAEIASVMNHKYQYVKSGSFLELTEAIQEERAKPGSPQYNAFKLFTKSNAIIILWGSDVDNKDGILLYTEELCKSIYGEKLKK